MPDLQRQIRLETEPPPDGIAVLVDIFLRDLEGPKEVSSLRLPPFRSGRAPQDCQSHCDQNDPQTQSECRARAEDIVAGGEQDDAALDNGAEEDFEISDEASEVGGVPWYVWPIAAAVVLGGVGYYGTKKGWF